MDESPPRVIRLKTRDWVRDEFTPIQDAQQSWVEYARSAVPSLGESLKRHLVIRRSPLETPVTDEEMERSARVCALAAKRHRLMTKFLWPHQKNLLEKTMAERVKIMQTNAPMLWATARETSQCMAAALLAERASAMRARLAKFADRSPKLVPRLRARTRSSDTHTPSDSIGATLASARGRGWLDASRMPR